MLADLIMPLTYDAVNVCSLEFWCFCTKKKLNNIAKINKRGSEHPRLSAEDRTEVILGRN